MNNIDLIKVYQLHKFHVVEKQGFLLISFSTPDKVNIITKLFQSDTPLTFNQVKEVYEQFYKLSKTYNCKQFRIICKVGFEQEATFFYSLNVALSGADYLQSLESISHIELYSHNDIAYSKLCDMLMVQNRACIIQPTGTGKSLIISKFLVSNTDKKNVVLTPSKFIISEIKKHLLNSNNVHFYTYSKLSFQTEEQIQKLCPDYIIVDEFHRCGAEEWGAGVDLLLKLFPQAKLIGTTATHIRYLDDKRNMADELFEGNVANHLTLSQALALGILQTPTYISALYNFNDDYLRVKKSLAESMAEDKLVKIEKLNKIKLEFDNTNSIPDILKEHLTDNIQKIIVFMKDVKHLKKHKQMVLNWFHQIGYNNLCAYEMHSLNEGKNYKIFQEFEKPHEDWLDIMFSVNMLNEGIHVNGVNCTIMLRDTESPIIYYQQMGRCLSISSNKSLIFDFVNNFANIRHRDLQNDVLNETNRLLNLYNKNGIPYDEINFSIIDKVRNLKELLEEVEKTANPINEFLKRILIYYEKYGHCNVPQKYNEDKWLARKVSDIRLQYRNKKLDENIVNKLKELDFVFNVFDNYLTKFYTELEEFYIKNGHCNVPSVYNVNKWLGRKVLQIRFSYKKGKLDQQIIDKLNQMGFVWDIYESFNNIFINQLEDYYKINGHCNVPATYQDKWLITKINTVRYLYKKGKLDQQIIDKLNNIDFVWYVSEFSDNTFINQLENYYKIYGHSNVPQSYSNKWLANRITKIRADYKKNQLSQEIIDKLNNMRFVWNPKEIYVDEPMIKFFNLLNDFKKIKNHCNVPATYQDKWLASKVCNIRQNYKSGKLSQEIIDKLNNMEFVWSLQSNSKNKINDKIKSFYKTNGHCNVPSTYEDTALANTISKFRINYKKGLLSSSIIKMLNDMHFIWDMNFVQINESWNNFFTKLNTFKKENGHCNVPATYQDKWLANKVSTTRRNYKKGNLDQQIIDKLNQMGFAWSLKN